MWGKKRKNGQLSPDALDTLIGEGIVIEGKVIAKTSIRIEGAVHGDIECAGDVTLGSSAIAKSIVCARNVSNSGVVHGSITAKERLSISKTGQVFGSVSAASLVIAEGGVLEGESRMKPRAQESGKAILKKHDAAEQASKTEKLAAVK